MLGDLPVLGEVGQLAVIGRGWHLATAYKSVWYQRNGRGDMRRWVW